MANSTFKNYLLGSLSDSEIERIEYRIIEDADFAEELSAFEEDLVLSFISGRLSDEDMNRFRSNYLVTEERIRNLEITALLHQYAAKRSVSKARDEAAKSDKAGMFNWFGSIRIAYRIALVSAAALLLCLSVWFVLPTAKDSALVDLQRKYEVINRDISSHEPGGSQLTLVPNALRSTGVATELVRTDLSGDVRFRLALGPGSDTSSKYELTLMRDSTNVFQMANIPAYPNREIPELRLVLPSEIFIPGNYLLTVTDEKRANLAYQFVVK